MDTGTYDGRASGGLETDPSRLSTGELIATISEQTSRLVRAEIQLGMRELQHKAKRAGLGAGMFGAAGVLGLYAGGALVTVAIAALALALDTWLAALIVALVLLAGAAVLALTGRKQIARAVPPAPEQAIESVKADIDTIKHKAHRA